MRRSGVRSSSSPPLFKKPTTLGWFFFARFPQCWRGFGPRCDGRRCPGRPGSGPFSVLRTHPFSVSAKDAVASVPALARVSGCLFVKKTAFTLATRPHSLKRRSIHYWGDIDTHGFGILDQLRGHFDHVVSFLMDRATLDAHVAIWGSEDKPLRVDLHRLTPEERTLYDDLRDNRIRPALRLEQEHIGFHWLAHRLHLLEDTTASGSGGLVEGPQKDYI